MPQRTVQHGAFTIERLFDTAPAQVFAAWPDPAVKPRLRHHSFNKKHSIFPEATLRGFIYHAEEPYSSRGIIPGNGLLPAIYRVGRKVLIAKAGFFEWLEQFRRRAAGVG